MAKEGTPISAEIKKEQDYFAWFALAHHSALVPHYKRGEVLGKKKVEPWIAKTTPHCLVAGAYADILIDTLAETGLPEYQLTQTDKKTVVDAAILHDWRKKKEVQTIDAARRACTLTYETLEEIKSADAAELQEMGFNENIIALTGANVSDSEMGPTTFPEQTIWYVDAMLSLTDAVPIAERFANLDRGWTGEREDPDRAARSKAFSKLFAPKYNGAPLFEVQRSIACRLDAQFATALGLDTDPSQFPLFLKGKLQERISNFTHPYPQGTQEPSLE